MTATMWGRMVPTSWLGRVCAAIVIIENAPCGSDCETWLEDDCTCGKEEALKKLWPLAGASPEHGRVTEGHPLQLARKMSSSPSVGWPVRA